MACRAERIIFSERVGRLAIDQTATRRGCTHRQPGGVIEPLFAMGGHKMTTQKDRVDPVTGLSHREIVDLRANDNCDKQDPPKEQQATTAAVEPKSAGLKRARWTQLEKDVQKLKVTRKPTKEILNALRPQYPDLTWEIVRSICNKRSKRKRR